MVRSFVFLAGLPVLPFRPDDKIDIVNVDFVADTIAMIHQKEKPDHDIYHLSSGVESQTFRELTDALARAQGKRGPIFKPGLERAFHAHGQPPGRAARVGSRLRRFAVESLHPLSGLEHCFRQRARGPEMNRAPAKFSDYSYPLLRFAKEGRFTYDYQEWPAQRRGGCRMSMDLALQLWVSGLIELTKFGWMLGTGKRWTPGERLKLLFTGYNGTRNTGADVRVEEMLRQVTAHTRRRER